jgi:hypothetical protein
LIKLGCRILIQAKERDHRNVFHKGREEEREKEKKREKKRGSVIWEKSINREVGERNKHF